MPTRNVVLTEQQAAMIERLVLSDRYLNASGGLRLARQRETEDDARLIALRQAASVGLEDFDTGRYRGFPDGKALRSHLAARADKSLAGHQSDASRLDGPAVGRGRSGLRSQPSSTLTTRRSPAFRPVSPSKTRRNMHRSVPAIIW